MAREGGRSPLLQSMLDSDDEPQAPITHGLLGAAQATRKRGSPRPATLNHPRPPLTPVLGVPPDMSQSNSLLPSAPASPPTPAPSPTPHMRANSWKDPTTELEDSLLRDFRLVFSRLEQSRKEAWLTAIVDSCDNHQLSHIHQLVSPRLKKDPFQAFPNELCFRVISASFLRLKTRLTFTPDPRIRRRPANLCPGLTSIKKVEGGPQ